MKNCASSFVPMNKQVVIDACNQTIAFVRKARAEADARFVKKYMDKYNRRHSRWYYRLFGMGKQIDEKEAKKLICKEGENLESFFNYPSMYGYGSESRAMKIKQAAERAEGDTVYVSTEDWDWIGYLYSKTSSTTGTR